MENIKGKSILLCIEPFHGYGGYIKEGLMRLGAQNVYLKTSVFFPGSFREYWGINTLKEYFLNPHARSNWTNEFIREIEGMHFDTMFVVENLPFKKRFLDEIRKKNPNIRIILFLWDTLKTQMSRFFDYFPKFDTIYSFDRDDAKKYGFRYFPDFYIAKEFIPFSQCKYDIAFVGSMNKSCTRFRGALLAKVQQYCEQNGLIFFFHLQYQKIDRSNKILRNFYLSMKNLSYNYLVKELLSKYSFMHSDSITIDKYGEIMANARVILDLSYPGRQGMTINAITALASGKKLITTNKRIAEESFYNPNYIHIIDETNPCFYKEFFQCSSNPLDLSYLKLDNWLKHVVNEDE